MSTRSRRVKKGRQIGANFFLTGEIADRVQEVGNKKYVYYKCTMNLINIQTGILEWANDKEIRKYYTKKVRGFLIVCTIISKGPV